MQTRVVRNEMQIHIEKKNHARFFSLENAKVGQRKAVSQDWKTPEAAVKTTPFKEQQWR